MRVVLVLALACAAAPAKKGARMTCTKTITPADSLSAVVKDLPDGAVLCLEAGVYTQVHLFVEKSLTVRGLGEVVLDGKFRASTVEVARPVDLTLEHLTLKNGSGGGMGGGGNLFVVEGKNITLREVVLENGEADANGGGGVFARGGVVVCENCTFRKNHGRRAHSILVQGPAQVTLRRCEVDAGAPSISVPSGSLTVEGSRIAGTLEGGGKVSVGGSRLQHALGAGITDAGGNVLE
jgi:hypothetical protein